MKYKNKHQTLFSKTQLKFGNYLHMVIETFILSKLMAWSNFFLVVKRMKEEVSKYSAFDSCLLLCLGLIDLCFRRMIFFLCKLHWIYMLPYFWLRKNYLVKHYHFPSFRTEKTSKEGWLWRFYSQFYNFFRNATMQVRFHNQLLSRRLKRFIFFPWFKMITSFYL
jgi:hypothetical protein